MKNGTMGRPSQWFVVLALLAVSCASARDFRATNREHLEELRPGMTRDAVLRLMGVGEQKQLGGSETQGTIGTGTDTLGVTSVRIPIGGRTPRLYNPHRSEIYSADGSTWEILYYYTHVMRADGIVTDDELTPLVLRDEVLEGWGWSFLSGLERRLDLGVEIPDPLPDPALAIE